MKTYPALEIDLDKIQRNAEAVTKICAARGICVTGVVKGVCGSFQVAQAMLAGGVCHIGDSRTANFERLRDNGVNCEFIMLRTPMLSQAAEVVRLCDMSLNSGLGVIEALGREALPLGRTHKVILMIELGDLREGVLPRDAPFVAERVMETEGVRLEGIGANLTCYGGVVPTEKNMTELAETALAVEARTGAPLNIVSGGNSGSLPLIMSGKMPEKINHLRVGEAILLGCDTIKNEPLPGAERDAFIFKAEVIEAGRKPSAPVGELTRDAFGGRPDFVDRGLRRRAILGAGRQDIMVSGLIPLHEKCEILGASSDHLLTDIEDCPENIKTGDVMPFRLEYGSLLGAMTSAYVRKDYLKKRCFSDRKTVSVISLPSKTADAVLGSGLEGKIEELGYAVSRRSVSDADLAAALAECVESGSFPLVLGDSGAAATGALRGAGRGGPRSAGLMFFGAAAPAWLAGVDGAAQESIAVIGLRQIDSVERDLLRKSRMSLFTMEKIDLVGMRETVSQALETLRHCSGGAHISFSMDAVSPEHAPGVSSPAEGGLSYREAHTAMEIISKSGMAVSMDMSGIEPSRDADGKTAKLAAGLICSLLGKRII
jgi:predicted amino acid racemase/arginase family enzyme